MFLCVPHCSLCSALAAILRWPSPWLCSRRISRYLVICMTSLNIVTPLARCIYSVYYRFLFSGPLRGFLDRFARNIHTPSLGTFFPEASGFGGGLSNKHFCRPLGAMKISSVGTLELLAVNGTPENLPLIRCCQQSIWNGGAKNNRNVLYCSFPVPSGAVNDPVN